MNLRSALLSRPSAVMAGPWASNDNPAALLQQINAAFSEHRDRTDARLDGLQAALNDQTARAVAGELGAGVTSAPVDATYSADFAAYLRNGEREDAIRAANRTGDRSAIRAAMSEGSNGDGGYLSPVEWDRRIIAAQRTTSPMRRLATVITTGVRAFSTLWSNEQWGSGWVGETAARPQTTNASFAPLTFAAGQIYAMPAVTQDLLDDAEINVAQLVSDQIGEEFGRQEGVAFINGDGINKPRGLLAYTDAALHPGGALDVAVSGAAGGLTSDGLVDFTYGLAAPYRQNARWLMNSTTGAAIAKMKDGQGNYLWREALAAGQPATLLGYPVEFDETMPAIAADATPIAFGDFKRGYLINDRLGTSVLRDPYSNKPFVLFYARKRVGGGVRDPRAIRLLRIGA